MSLEHRSPAPESRELAHQYGCLRYPLYLSAGQDQIWKVLVNDQDRSDSSRAQLLPLILGPLFSTRFPMQICPWSFGLP